MADSKDYYEILGLTKSATEAEIKRAYRKLALQYHPDRNKGKDAEGKFKEVTKAYEVLSDPQKKQTYDQFGHAAFEQGAGQNPYGGAGGPFGGAQGGPFSYTYSTGGDGGAGFDFGGFSAKGGPASGWDFGDIGFDDIFSNIFGGGGRRKTRKKAGRDIQVDAEITFEEMVKGSSRNVKIYKNVVCEKCHGTGGEPGAKKETCPTCHGSGQIRKTMQSLLGRFSEVHTCPTCEGAGEIYSEKCKRCGGDGRVKEEQNIEIDIPAGIQHGQTLSLEGQGEAGEKGAPSGDLYVNIHVIPHKKFKREKNNILSEEQITFSQAVLGDKIEVETIDGKLQMKIPAGTQSGEVFKIRDEGVPFLDRRGKGDQLVKIIVKIPKHLNREQKELIERLKEID